MEPRVPWTWEGAEPPTATSPRAGWSLCHHPQGGPQLPRLLRPPRPRTSERRSCGRRGWEQGRGRTAKPACPSRGGVGGGARRGLLVCKDTDPICGQGGTGVRGLCPPFCICTCASVHPACTLVRVCAPPEKQAPHIDVGTHVCTCESALCTRIPMRARMPVHVCTCAYTRVRVHILACMLACSGK